MVLTHGSANSKRGSPNLHDRRRVVRQAGRRACAVLRVRASVRDTAGAGRDLQSSLQRRRQADGSKRVRRRYSVGSHREETLLSRISGIAGTDVWNARLRLSLQLLSELGYLTSIARPEGTRPSAGTDTA